MQILKLKGCHSHFTTILSETSVDYVATATPERLIQPFEKRLQQKLDILKACICSHVQKMKHEPSCNGGRKFNLLYMYFFMEISIVADLPFRLSCL